LPLSPHGKLKVRVRILRDLETWAEGPIRMLSFAWVLLVLGQLLHPGVRLLETFGTAIWAIFIIEFLVRVSLAPHKLRFLRQNWLTAMALLVPGLRLAPMLRALPFLTALGGGQVLVLLGTVNRTMIALREGLGRRKVAFVMVLTVVVLALGAAGMLRFEPHASKTGVEGFTGYGDALWWTGMLMTTIGSAYWPQTSAGRVLGFLLSVYSIGVFGYLTAALSSFFVGQDAASNDGPIAGADDITDLRAELAAIRRELERLNGLQQETQ
jgi:voltage-gated potassium channel